MSLKELMRAREAAAQMLVTLDPLSKLFGIHYKTWRTFDDAISRKLAEGADA